MTFYCTYLPARMRKRHGKVATDTALYRAPLRHSTPLLTSALLLMSCSPANQHPLKKTSVDSDAGEQAVPVEIATLEAGPLEAALRFSTNLEAEKRVMVLSRTTGQVRSIQVEEGDIVKRRGILLRLQADEVRARASRARIALTQAQRMYNKAKQLHAKGIRSDQDLDSAQFELSRAEIAHHEATLALNYTIVRAPLAGVVTQRMVKHGDLVIPNQRLFGVTDFSSLVARVHAPEKQLGALSPGLAARITPQGDDATMREGTIERVAPAVDPRTGTVKVTVALPNAEGLLPGMFVEVQLILAQKTDALLLPKRALVYDNEEPFAMRLVDGNRVERIRVEFALSNRDFVEPAAGFRLGDQVVVAGQIGLKNGALVTVQPPPTATAPSVDTADEP